MCKIADVIVAVLMVAAAYRDWKTKQISFGLLAFMTFLVMLFRFTVIEDSVWSTVGGIFIGIGFFVVSKCTREAIGYGDSWLILLLGIYLGGRALLEVIFVSSLLASLFSVYYCLRRGWNKKYAFPFVPFLTATYLGVVFL